MSVKLSRMLKKNRVAAGAPTIREYEEGFKAGRDGAVETSAGHQEKVNNLYYDLVTDFYEYGWGRSFHFAPRVLGESFKASLARHERFLAEALELRPGMVVADIGCGVGGPLLEIARHSGAKIVGVNSNAYQLERARRYTKEAGLTHLAEYLHCDFLNVDAPDESFNAVYSIEATCCAPDKLSIYGEVFRLLKPGAGFGVYEYSMTDRFDATDPVHLKLKADIALGGGLLVIDDRPTIDSALRSVGFEVLETRGPSGTDRPFGSLVPAPSRRRPFFRRFSQLEDWTLGHAKLAEGDGDDPYCAAGPGPSSGDTGPVRGRHGGGGPARYLHADVLHPRPQAGVAQVSRRAPGNLCTDVVSARIASRNIVIPIKL